MKLRKLIDWIYWNNGFQSREIRTQSGLTAVDFLTDTDHSMLYTDKTGDEWKASYVSTIPVIYNSNTTGLTVSTIPAYLGGPSAYTYQLYVINNHRADVTLECTYSSRNTQVARVSATGLVSGYYTGSTLAYIGVQHPDMASPVSANTFTVAQIVTAITPYVTSFTGVTGETYSALTYTDQWNNSIPTARITRTGYSTGIVYSIDLTGGTIGLGYSGTTYITAYATLAGSSINTTTTVKVVGKHTP